MQRRGKERQRKDEQGSLQETGEFGQRLQGEKERKKERKQALAKGLGRYWDARDGCGVMVQRQWDLYLQIGYLDEKWLCYHREFLKLFTRSVFLTALKIWLDGADDSQHKSTEGS